MRTIEHAERGARLLDERLPGWRKIVDPDTLVLSSGCNCVLGQLFGSYSKGVDLLELEQDELVQLGFFRPTGVQWSTMTNAWRKVLRRRT